MSPWGDLEGQRFGAIVADPPWRFEGYDKQDRTERHYPTMTLAQIQALPVAELAGENCALFLWATDPLLPAALETMAAWGFGYRTVGFTWIKLQARQQGAPRLFWTEADVFTGMGFWTRSNPEICLLGARGRPERLARDVHQVIVAPRREHSRKPDAALERVERLVGGPYLELFSRTSRPGWAAWGNETGKFDEGIAA